MWLSFLCFENIALFGGNPKGFCSACKLKDPVEFLKCLQQQSMLMHNYICMNEYENMSLMSFDSKSNNNHCCSARIIL